MAATSSTRGGFAPLESALQWGELGEVLDLTPEQANLSPGSLAPMAEASPRIFLSAILSLSFLFPLSARERLIFSERTDFSALCKRFASLQILKACIFAIASTSVPLRFLNDTSDFQLDMQADVDALRKTANFQHWIFFYKY